METVFQNSQDMQYQPVSVYHGCYQQEVPEQYSMPQIIQHIPSPVYYEMDDISSRSNRVSPVPSANTPVGLGTYPFPQSVSPSSHQTLSPMYRTMSHQPQVFLPLSRSASPVPQHGSQLPQIGATIKQEAVPVVHYQSTNPRPVCTYSPAVSPVPQMIASNPMYHTPPYYEVATPVTIGCSYPYTEAISSQQSIPYHQPTNQLIQAPTYIWQTNCIY